MQIINVRGPLTTLWSSSGSEYTGSTSADQVTPPAIDLPRTPIEDLLIKVGKILLGDELHTDYFAIGKVARVAQKCKIRWAGCTHRADKLEEIVLQHFQNNDRILGDGIKVTWRTQRDGWENELQLRFHQYDPANDGPIQN